MHPWAMTAAALTMIAAAPAQAAAAAPAAAPAPTVTASPPSEVFRSGTRLMTLEEAKAHYRGPLSQVVLEFLTVMDRVVNKDKQPVITEADWAPLGAVIDRERFRRVGNFGVRNDWPSYAGLLTAWARSNWWKGYIWRMREVPGSPGEPGLVYLESEERSSNKHPVRDDGDYSSLASIAVYEIGADNRITSLHVYDQRPM